MLAHSSFGFNLECSDLQDTFLFAGNILSCVVSRLDPITAPDVEIPSVNGVFEPTDYEGLVIVNKTVHFLPEGMQYFFPQMIRMKISYCQLKSVDRGDFEWFPYLKNLHLDNNDLKVLEGDLFRRNYQLEHLNLDCNKIKFIGPGFTTGLNNLVEVYLLRNECINFSITASTQIPQLESKLKNCVPSHGMRMKTVLLDVLEQPKKAAELQTSNDELKRKNEKLEALNRNLNDILDAATKKLLNTSKKIILYHKLDDENESYMVDMIVSKSSDPAFQDNLSAPQPEQLFAVNLKIDSENTQIREVQGAVNATNAKKLVIEHQQTLMLPTNLGEHFLSLEKLAVIKSGLFVIDAGNFADLGQLKVLNLTGNKLSEVTSGTFDSLSKLVTLDLSSNNIEILEHDVFKALTGLITLDLGHNLLSSTDDKLFESSKHLEVLLMNDNRLKTLDNNFLTSLTALTKVDLSNNVCIDIQHPKATLKDIEAKIIDHCIAPVDITCKAQFELQEMSEITGKINCVAVNLVISYPKTKISDVKCDLKEDVEIFSALDQTMLFMPYGMATKFSKLKEINIQRSKLTALQQHDFDGLAELKQIWITFNNISSIGAGAFDSVPQVETLCLASNNIQNLPANIFANQSRLKTLILSDNQLKRLPANILKSRNIISDFEVQNNQLEFIDPKILRSLKTAKTIDLTGNTCINQKLDNPKVDIQKAFVELYGAIDMFCSEGSSERQ